MTDRFRSFSSKPTTSAASMAASLRSMPCLAMRVPPRSACLLIAVYGRPSTESNGVALMSALTPGTDIGEPVRNVRS